MSAHHQNEVESFKNGFLKLIFSEVEFIAQCYLLGPCQCLRSSFLSSLPLSPTPVILNSVRLRIDTLALACIALGCPWLNFLLTCRECGEMCIADTGIEIHVLQGVL